MSEENIENLKKWRTWSLKNSPEFLKPVLKPVLSYALDWLTPELVGVGFEVIELNDFKAIGLLPLNEKNLNRYQELSQGLVINAAEELIFRLLNQHWPIQSLKVTCHEVHISKNINWNTSIKIEAELNSVDVDKFSVKLQKKQISEMVLNCKVYQSNLKKIANEENFKFAGHVEFKFSFEPIQQIEFKS